MHFLPIDPRYRDRESLAKDSIEEHEQKIMISPRNDHRCVFGGNNKWSSLGRKLFTSIYPTMRTSPAPHNSGMYNQGNKKCTFDGESTQRKEEAENFEIHICSFICKSRLAINISDLYLIYAQLSLILLPPSILAIPLGAGSIGGL